jgi:hypothetical protein
VPAARGFLFLSLTDHFLQSLSTVALFGQLVVQLPEFVGLTLFHRVELGFRNCSISLRAAAAASG